MSVYATDHADALADVLEAGEAVSFTRTTQTHNPLTEVITSSTSTIAGAAIRVRTQDSKARYGALGLVETEAATLLFVPSTYGEFPKPGDKCTWEGVPYTVRDVDPCAPDGTVIFARVVISR